MPQLPKEKPQIDRFKEAARQLEVDESEAAFDEKLKEIAKHKPKDEPLKQKK
jgi:hypothetical protein